MKTKTTAIDDAVPLAILLATLVLAATPAHAATDDCTARIAAAWTRVADAPAYRQSVDMPKLAMRMESVVIGNDIWTIADGKTNRTQFPPGGRKKMVERFVGATPTVSCTMIGEETIDGRATLVYDFTRAPLPGLEKAPVQQKVWIGKTDGLVRRLVGPDATVSVSYENIEAPR